MYLHGMKFRGFRLRTSFCAAFRKKNTSLDFVTKKSNRLSYKKDFEQELWYFDMCLFF